MSKKIIVYTITTGILGKEQFLTTYSKNERNQIVCTGYSTNAADARQWPTAADAKQAMVNIKNLNDRKFDVKALEVVEEVR